jgi:excisionase family DNA binding protein
MTDPWPWPGDTPTERARRIANSLLALLPDQQRDHAIRQARAVGETWLGRTLLRWDKTDAVTTAEAAELLHVNPSTIRKWHSEGHLPNHQGRTGVYVVAHVLDCAAQRRRERATMPG